MHGQQNIKVEGVYCAVRTEYLHKRDSFILKWLMVWEHLLGSKATEACCWRLTPSAAEAENQWSYNTTPPYTFIAYSGKTSPVPSSSDLCLLKSRRLSWYTSFSAPTWRWYRNTSRSSLIRQPKSSSHRRCWVVNTLCLNKKGTDRLRQLWLTIWSSVSQPPGRERFSWNLSF